MLLVCPLDHVLGGAACEAILQILCGFCDIFHDVSTSAVLAYIICSEQYYSVFLERVFMRFTGDKDIVMNSTTTVTCIASTDMVSPVLPPCAGT